MLAVKARVRNGRLVVDEPTDLPEGTELDLFADQDDADEEERAALEASLERGRADIAAGRSISADALMAKLQARR